MILKRGGMLKHHSLFKSDVLRSSISPDSDNFDHIYEYYPGTN